jgi:RNA polymerase sigma factor (sigma-70 family)
LSIEQEERMRAAMPWVDEIAARMAARKPGMSVGDFKSAGYDEIWRATLVYVETKGATFRTFAWPGVLGAMLDVAAKHRAQDPTRAALTLLGVSVLSHFRDDADPFSEADEDKRARMLNVCQNAVVAVEAVLACATWREQGEEGLALHHEHVKATEELENARALLDPEENAIVEMRFWDDLPWGQVADALGTSESTVKRRAAAAQAKLKHDLMARGVHEAPAVEGR